MRERRFAVPERIYPFADRWFEWGRTALHYLDHGSGPAVVLLHGELTWSLMYRRVATLLAPHARCLVPDLPAHGLSERPPGFRGTAPEHAAWLEAWSRALELRCCVLVAHGWGGPIGLSRAVAHPDCVAGLVLLNTWCWPASRLRRGLERAAGAPGLPLLGLCPDGEARWPLDTRSRLDPAVWAAYAAGLPSPELRVHRAWSPAAESRWLAGVERGLPRLSGKPVEFVWGLCDPELGRPAVRARWRRHFPDAPWTELPDACHLVPEESPEAVAAAVRRVLARAGLRGPLRCDPAASAASTVPPAG